MTEAEKKPKVLYHGANLFTSSAIMRDRRLRADQPLDDDGLGAVVCTSSSRKVARMFAVEFERHNSRLPVGAIFVINAISLPKTVQMISHSADTQGTENEREFRVTGDIPFDCVLGAVLVGETRKLRSERWLEVAYNEDEEARRLFWSFDDFYHAVSSLVTYAKKQGSS